MVEELFLNHQINEQKDAAILREQYGLGKVIGIRWKYKRSHLYIWLLYIT
jgi:hypothetical protein